MVALISPIVDGAATVYLAYPDDVTSAHHLEIPIAGPGEANTLVIVNGIAVPDLTTDERLGTEDTIHLNFEIDTDYDLRDNDVLIDSSAYVCLSSIEADDDDGGGEFESGEFRLALETADVLVRPTGKVVQLKASGAAGGDTGLHRIGYQLNLLVRREA